MRWTSIKAESAELELSRKTGELVPVAAVEEQWNEVIDILRANLLSPPRKLTARMGTFKMLRTPRS
jgi:hypothetical protein